MVLDKVYRMHPTFEGWVQAHRHSSVSVECALKDSIEIGTDDPIKVLKSYVSRLEELRGEVRGETDEARYWIRYFKQQKG